MKSTTAVRTKHALQRMGKRKVVGCCLGRCRASRPAPRPQVPYLKGIEVLPLEEAVKAISDCEAAADAIHKGISEAGDAVASRQACLASESSCMPGRRWWTSRRRELPSTPCVLLPGVPRV